MRLYHFTCEEHMPSILAYGVLRTTSPNLASRDRHGDPRVLWTTTDQNPGGKHGLNTPAGMHDKEAVRFTLEVPDEWVFEWEPWADSRGIGRQHKGMLLTLAGGHEVAKTWRLVDREVPHDMWVLVENLRTGKTYNLSSVGTGDPLPPYYSDACLETVASALAEALVTGLVRTVTLDNIEMLLIEQPIAEGHFERSDARRLSRIFQRDRVADKVMDQLALMGFPIGKDPARRRIAFSPSALRRPGLVRSGDAATDRTPQRQSSGSRRPKKRPAKTHGKRKRCHR